MKTETKLPDAKIENSFNSHELFTKKSIKSYAMAVGGSILYAFAFCWIIELGRFFTGGVTGTAQLIVGLIEKFGGSTSIRNYLGLLIALINVPLVLFGWRGVSRQFAILTVVSIVIQTVSISIISNLTISPFVMLLESDSKGVIDALRDGSFNIGRTEANIALQTAFQTSMKPGTRLLIALIGGGLTGAGAAICLKGGGSTGGMDIVANFLMMKKGISFTKYQLTVDLTVIGLSSLISIENVLYTIVRLFTYMKVIESIYKTYNTNQLEVITTKAEEIRIALLKEFTHGMTIFSAVGGYTLTEKKVIEIYVSNFEIQEYIAVIKSIDPHAFIVSTRVSIMKSNYVQRTIV